MELKTAIEILDYHQEWRLGKRDDMIHEPKKLTEALDLVLSQVKKDLIAGVVKPKGTVCKHKGCEHRYTNELDGFCLKHYTQKSN
ncbi:MAG: hypothetical protein ACI85F_002372 [Bacteroidia bacterium]|jgi:hypothetical protein